MIVGFYPALIFQGNNAVLAYRDGHFGQSAGTGDWNSADLEMAIGGPTAWTPVALLQAGNAKGAAGRLRRPQPDHLRGEDAAAAGSGRRR